MGDFEFSRINSLFLNEDMILLNLSKHKIVCIKTNITYIVVVVVVFFRY